MQHGPTQKAAFDLAPRQYALAHRQGFLLGWVEVEETQGAGVGAVVHGHDQLAPGPKTHLAVGHPGFDLRSVAVAHIAQLGDAGLVLVAQRQVQRQVDVALETQLVQRLLRGAFGG